MGVTVKAIMGHSLAHRELESLPDLLNTASGQSNRPADWEWCHPPGRDWTVDDVSLHGGGHCHVWLSPYTLVLVADTYWAAFLQDDSVQLPLRAFIRQIGAAVGARTVLYLPDSRTTLEPTPFDPDGAALDDWLPFENILANLAATVGPPAPSLRSMYRENAEIWWSVGYFLEELTP